MAKLTEDQAKQLAELEALRDAPDEPAGNGRAEHVNVTIDLSDEKAVERGLRLGFLKAGDLDDDDGDDDGDDGGDKPPKDRTPKRRGFFPE